MEDKLLGRHVLRFAGNEIVYDDDNCIREELFINQIIEMCLVGWSRTLIVSFNDQ